MEKLTGGASIPRKEFLSRLTTLGAVTALGLPALAAGPKINEPVDVSGSDNILIKDGYILSMDTSIGDLPKGDVHIQQGSIINVGVNIEAPGATILNGQGMIVMPGMIETHWHLWTSVLRVMAGSRPGLKYFDITSMFGKWFTPEDMYISTRLGLTEAIYSGITFAHDWCHNVRSPDHAEASIKAIREEGIRARFSVGLPAGANQETDVVDLNIIDELRKKQSRDTDKNLVSLGLAWPEPGSNAELRTKELKAARAWGLPISVHAGRKSNGEDSITRIQNFLGSDLQVIHGVKSSADELRMMAAAGSSLSISPFSELRIGYGFPPVPEMLASKINIGLSVDTFPLSGNADMFAVMKVFLNLANGMSQDEFVCSARRILEIVTIEGARSMGMEKYIGSLTPGKRADIIMIDTNAPNMKPVVDPVLLLVTAAQPANVDTVIIDGKLLKRGGLLMKSNTGDLFRQSEELLNRLKKQTGW